MAALFLTVEEVLALHQDSLDLFGGMAGVRDRGLLESALAQPPMTFAGALLHPDLFAMAAAYLFHIVRNHPFMDGNKRAGLAAAGTFLALNGFDIGSQHTDQLYDLTMAVAEGRMAKDEVAGVLRRLASPVAETDG